MVCVSAHPRPRPSPPNAVRPVTYFIGIWAPDYDGDVCKRPTPRTTQKTFKNMRGGLRASPTGPAMARQTQRGSPPAASPRDICRIFTLLGGNQTTASRPGICVELWPHRPKGSDLLFEVPRQGGVPEGTWRKTAWGWGRTRGRARLTETVTQPPGAGALAALKPSASRMAHLSEAEADPSWRNAAPSRTSTVCYSRGLTVVHKFPSKTRSRVKRENRQQKQTLG